MCRRGRQTRQTMASTVITITNEFDKRKFDRGLGCRGSTSDGARDHGKI